MVIRTRENWFRMLFVWKGSVLPKIASRLLVLLLFSILVHALHGILFSYKVSLNPSAFTLVGVALAIFLAFCNNAAYDRFWEGRKLWGALVIDTRSVVRQVTAYCSKTGAEDIALMVVCYAYCLKHQLRQSDATQDIDRFLPADRANRVKSAQFKPVWLLKEMAQQLQAEQNNNQIDSITKMGIDQNLDKLSGIVGGCERISNTPIPFAYHILLHRTVYIYCFLLPFGLVDSIGWMMPLIVTFVGYTFMALDAIVDEISEPFGIEQNDLALDSICNTVEKSLFELIEKPVTTYEKPQNHADWYLN